MKDQSFSTQLGDSGGFLYEHWHDRFLKAVLQGCGVLGFIATSLYLFTAFPLAYKLLAIVAYGILLSALFLTSLRYPVRAGIFLLLLYAVSLTVLLHYGLAAGSIVFLGFVTMVSLLFPWRTGMYVAVGIGLLSVLGFGSSGSSITEWVKLTGIFVVVSSAIAIGVITLQQEYIRTQRIAHQAIHALQEEHVILEQRVESQTTNLTRISEQLRAMADIVRKITDIQDLAALLDSIAKLVASQFEFYHTAVFLINETGNQVILQAASSEGGQRMIEKGYSFSVGTQGAVGYVAAQKKPRISLDIGDDAVLFNNPDLPLTRSEIALPLMIRNRILGVLDIHSDKPQAFGADDIDILQALSDQIAIVIENARLIDETRATIMQLDALTSVRTREVWSQKLRDSNRAFTYTPLGLRVGKLSQSTDKAISVPIMLRGQKIGNISIARKDEATWTRLDQDLIEEVANQVGLAIDNIRLLEDATQRAKQEQTVGKLAARFSQSLDLDTLLQTAARELGQLPDISEVSVFIGQESQPKQHGKHSSS